MKVIQQPTQIEKGELFSRQVTLFDPQCVARSTVGLVGSDCTLAEIAKNLLCIGVGNLLLLRDKAKVRAADVSGAGFCFREADLGNSRTDVLARWMRSKGTHFGDVVVLDDWKAIEARSPTIVVVAGNMSSTITRDVVKACDSLGIPVMGAEVRGLIGSFAFGSSKPSIRREPPVNTVWNVKSFDLETREVELLLDESMGEKKLARNCLVQFFCPQNPSNESAPVTVEEVDGTKLRVELPEDWKMGFDAPAGIFLRVVPRSKAVRFKRFTEVVETEKDLYQRDRMDWARLALIALRTSPRTYSQTWRKLAEAEGRQLNDEMEDFFIHVGNSWQAEIGAVHAVIGGLATQEVMKFITGMHVPFGGYDIDDADRARHQVYFYEFVDILERVGIRAKLRPLGISPENLPIEPLPQLVRPQNDFPDLEQTWDVGMRYAFEEETMERVRRARLVVVGAGATGCELLKNLTQMGVATHAEGLIHVLDNDTVTTSNLSRQFLYNTAHVTGNIGKAQAACAELNRIQPALNCEFTITRLQATNPFNCPFTTPPTALVSCVDSFKARDDLDQIADAFGVPLFDCGTRGIQGNVIMVYPKRTTTLALSVPRGEVHTLPCTPKVAMYLTEHCIHRALWLLETTEKTPTLFKDIFETEIRQWCQSEEHKASWMEKHVPRPLEFKNAAEAQLRKRFETALASVSETKTATFDKDRADHMEFVHSAACLYSTIFSVPQPSLLDVRLVAGKMDSAVITTTAIVSGLSSLNLLRHFVCEPDERTILGYNYQLTSAALLSPIPRKYNKKPLLLEYTVAPESTDADLCREWKMEGMDLIEIHVAKAGLSTKLTITTSQKSGPLLRALRAEVGDASVCWCMVAMIRGTEFIFKAGVLRLPAMTPEERRQLKPEAEEQAALLHGDLPASITLPTDNLTQKAFSQEMDNNREPEERAAFVDSRAAAPALRRLDPHVAVEKDELKPRETRPTKPAKPEPELKESSEALQVLTQRVVEQTMQNWLPQLSLSQNASQKQFEADLLKLRTELQQHQQDARQAIQAAMKTSEYEEMLRQAERNLMSSQACKLETVEQQLGVLAAGLASTESKTDAMYKGYQVTQVLLLEQKALLNARIASFYTSTHAVLSARLQATLLLASGLFQRKKGAVVGAGDLAGKAAEKGVILVAETVAFASDCVPVVGAVIGALVRKGAELLDDHKANQREASVGAQVNANDADELGELAARRCAQFFSGKVDSEGSRFDEKALKKAGRKAGECMFQAIVGGKFDPLLREVLADGKVRAARETTVAAMVLAVQKEAMTTTGILKKEGGIFPWKLTEQDLHLAVAGRQSPAQRAKQQLDEEEKRRNNESLELLRKQMARALVREPPPTSSPPVVAASKGPSSMFNNVEYGKCMEVGCKCSGYLHSTSPRCDVCDHAVLRHQEI